MVVKKKSELARDRMVAPVEIVETPFITIGNARALITIPVVRKYAHSLGGLLRAPKPPPSFDNCFDIRIGNGTIK